MVGVATDSQDPGPDLPVRRRLSQEAFKIMLKAMYHGEPRLELEWCKNLADLLPILGRVVDFYGCSAIVEPRMDHLLRRHWNEVLEDCKRDPVKMLRLGVAVRSDWITKECCTYLIGSEGDLAIGDLAIDVPAELILLHGLINVINAEKARVKSAVAAADRQLLLLYIPDPGWNGHPRLAMSVWHQWLIRHMRTDGRSSALYRMIQKGFEQTDICLEGDILVKHFNEGGVYPHLTTPFRDAKHIVEPFLVDATLSKAPYGPDDGFRFMTISDADLPWEAAKV